MPDWTPTLGAVVDGGATTFRVWAPDWQSIDLVVHRRSAAPGMDDIRPLIREQCGYWVGRFADIGHGDRYRYRVDGRADMVFPDPASRSQPEGVHGPSEVIDPRRFAWTDREWQPPALRDLVIYELHVGTFTEAGTYRAAIERLPYLTRLGVTAIELMPIGDFPGGRNWGYDGVAIFAPAHCYGSPGDLRTLVDAAHRHGLAVHLDVVYNHLGPDGAYANAFSPYYFTDAHRTSWGAGVNLDGPHSAEVRRFFIENALHWIREYHIDGLRLDATHAMRDDSLPHLLAELTATIRTHAPKPVVVTAEDHRNLARMVQPAADGGFGLDAVWADDFHHEVRVHTAGDRDGYYADYTGSMADLATTIRQGWFFTGQYSTHLGMPRGTSAAGIPPRQFVICVQNHDQVGNRADGARLHHQIEPEVYRAAATLLLLAPQTPLLFMGQEWAATSPFLFFTDHDVALGRLVTEGRRREFSAFDAFGQGIDVSRIPDPQDFDTFRRSRLDWTEPSREPHAGILRLYERLLALRRASPAVRHATCRSYEVHSLDAHTIAVHLGPVASQPDEAGARAATPSASTPGHSRQSLHVLVRLSGGAGTASAHVPPGGAPVVTTEDPSFVENPAPIRVARERPDPAGPAGTSSIISVRVEFSRPGAIVFAAPPPRRETP